MKKRRLLALIIAALLPVSMLGCSDGIHWRFNQDDDKSESSEKEEPSENADKNSVDSVDIDTVKEHVETLLADAEISGNEDKLREDIDILLKDLDSISEELSYTTIEFYTDWYDTKLEKKYDSLYEDFYVAFELLTYGFSNCYEIEEYSELFEPYIEAEYLDYYTDPSMSLRRLEGYTRVDYEVMDESLDKYYDIAYDEELSDDEKNLRCAELYLEILAGYDTESMYEYYNRDFTGEDVIKLSPVVYSEFMPIVTTLEDIFLEIPDAEDIYYEKVGPENPVEAVYTHANLVSDEIAEAANLLRTEELYTLAEGDDCYDGSFTTDLPLQNSALMYLYQYGDYYDLITAIHEFGHFYASLYDDTPTYLMGNNIDIAEIQSQGMEMLFMPMYDKICGDQAEAMQVMKLYDMIDSIISGFLVGEFEYTILKNIDTMTPEAVVECFDELFSEYNPDADLYYISHIFESPGYYISYGVSALAALDIWEASLTDYGKAVEMYENIARVKSNASESQFSAALQSCGFDDVLNEDYIIRITDALMQYCETIE